MPGPKSPTQWSETEKRRVRKLHRKQWKLARKLLGTSAPRQNSPRNRSADPERAFQFTLPTGNTINWTGSLQFEAAA